MILRSRKCKDITSVPAEGRTAIGIGYVPQGRQIYPLLSVEENLRIELTVIPVEQKLPFARRLGNDYVSMDRGEDLVRQYLTV